LITQEDRNKIGGSKLPAGFFRLEIQKGLSWFIIAEFKDVLAFIQLFFHRLLPIEKTKPLSVLEDKEIGKVLKSVSGLGEESTRSNIIERLKTLDYIDIVKNRLAPTQKAFILIDAVQNTVLASPELTGRWEQRLKEIGQGKASAKNFIDQSKKLAGKIVSNAKHHADSWQFDKYTSNRWKKINT
jgi:hypothetical protein